MNIKIEKIIGNTMFLLTLISPMLAYALAGMIGEVEIFHNEGIIRYSWIMLLFIPIGIISILIGWRLKQKKQKYKKNYIIAFICIPLLILMSSYSFLTKKFGISYDVDKIYNIENKTNIDLPHQIKIATGKYDSYIISYLKITDENEKNSFEQNIQNNELWENQLGSKISSLLPYNIQAEISNFDYFVFYNVTNNEYNLYPYDGEYECVCIAYDCEMHRMIIVDELKVNIN